MSSTIIDRFAPRFISHAQTVLRQLHDDVNGIRLVMLATADGFMLAASTPTASEKLAAVGSSMLAMGSALVYEAGFEGCRSLTIEAMNGQVYVREVNVSGTSMILLILFAQGTALAHVLHGARKTGEALSQVDQVLVN